MTGATAGLGRAVAARLAAVPGWTVVVAGRDPARTRAAATAVGGVALPLDLAELSSVRTFPDLLAAADLPALGAVVANAGIQFGDRRHTTAEGFEATFGTNHLAHQLLLRLLLPRLDDDGRLVVVTSGTHHARRIRNMGFPPPRWDDPRRLAQPGPGSGQVAYATSKLANVMTVLELRARLDELRPGGAIAVHGFDPGLMPDTDLARDYPAWARRIYAQAAPLIARLPGATTAAASAQQLARMVTDAGFAGPGGRYIELDRDGTPSAQARDRTLAAELWDVSCELAPA